MFLWGVWGLESKFVIERCSPATIQLLFIIGLPLPLLLLPGGNPPPESAERKRGIAHALVSGLTTALGNIAFFLALATGDASTVVPVTSLAPLGTVALAAVALKERMNPFQWLGLAIAVVSIYLLST